MFERVDIHNQQIDGENAVLMHRVFMGTQVAVTEEAAVNHRVQSLDAAIHHLWEFRQLAHVFDRDASGGNRAVRASR